MDSVPPPPDPETPSPPRETAPDPMAGVPVKRRDKLGFDMVGTPEVSWGLPQAFAGLMIAFGFIVVSSGVVAIIAGAAGDSDFESPTTLLASQAMVVLAFAGTAFYFAGWNREGLAKLGLGPIGIKVFGFGAAAWLGYLVLAIPIAALFQPEQQDVTTNLGVDDGTSLQLAIAGVLIIAGAAFSEEIFFRGFFFTGLRERLSFLWAAVVSGFVFGSLHLVSGDWAVALQLSVFGVVLAYIYDRSGSLWASIIAHAINNSIAFTLLVSGVN